MNATKELRSLIIDELKSLNFELDENVVTKFINGYHNLALLLNQEELILIQQHSKLMGIELYRPFEDESLQTVMSATYTQQGLSLSNNNKGTGIGIYMSEYGCPPNSHITNYQMLETSPDSDHARRTSAIMRTISPYSTIYCRGGV